MVDGGYADNTAMLSNLAQMQRDCTKAGDCSDLSLVIFNAVGHSSNSTGLSSDNIFSYSDDTSKNNTMPLFIEPYFSDYIWPNGNPSYDSSNVGDTGIGMAPWQAFAEAFPPQSEWIPYARTESSDIYATFWAGMLTTVDNEWYGIRSGQRVRVLILNQQSQGQTITGDGECAMSEFREHYAPAALYQATGLEPVLEAFLANSSAPTREWASQVGRKGKDPESLYEGSAFGFARTFLWAICVYLTAYFLATAVHGLILGRPGWWKGPYFPGQLPLAGLGDHSVKDTWRDNA